MEFELVMRQQLDHYMQVMDILNLLSLASELLCKDALLCVSEYIGHLIASVRISFHVDWHTILFTLRIAEWAAEGGGRKSLHCTSMPTEDIVSDMDAA